MAGSTLRPLHAELAECLDSIVATPDPSAFDLCVCGDRRKDHEGQCRICRAGPVHCNGFRLEEP